MSSDASAARIVSATLRPCSQALSDPDWKFARATVPRLDGWVVVLEDGAGVRGLGYAHAIPAITDVGDGVAAALAFLLPLLPGRAPAALNGIMRDVDARLAFANSAKAAIDMALHDLLARQLGVPLHVLLGGAVRAAVAQARIVPIKAPAAMAAHAAQLAQQGYRQLKLKLAGDALDVARVAEVRAAAGADVVLTLDPNQSYDAKRMMRAFARMERHDIALIEQPLPAADWAGMKLLAGALPPAIEADESAATLDDVLGLVNGRVVDAINLKVTKLGGLRKFAAAAAICEAGGVTCRVGATFGPALLQAAALHAAACVGSLPLGCELAEHLHLRDDPFTPLPVAQGEIAVPDGAGCGVAYAD
ncbi:mandelate racemase/muconate lactonizing enzyme family protein [uncultured Massilia sp.]|uniref:mandelate racemase/muconate lactonizing enzyme family protein n=1 Tax=uncultured Massilia sp. TaxID=169973 RepID=UPI0025EFBD56|nr:enolase C-terminal domain-like protein [uncultured Massilia sp.]